jgi:hypothetical protein
VFTLQRSRRALYGAGHADLASFPVPFVLLVSPIQFDSLARDLYNDSMTTAGFRSPLTSEGIHAHLVGYVNLFSGL